MLRALRYRNYRFFFVGQAISLVGTWLQLAALSWLVFRLTNSAFMLGLLAFASQVPAFFLTPLAGVMVDRWSRYRILVVVQVLAMAQAVVLAVLFFSGSIAIWQIMLLSTIMGLIIAFEMPARHAFVFDLVDDKLDIGNAIALNSSVFNMARLVGPFAAGILIAKAGEGICFVINSVSYLAVIAAFAAMRAGKPKKKIASKNVWSEMKEGARYAFGIMPIRYIIMLVGLSSLAGVPYIVLMPVFATEILGGGPELFGFLLASSGVGAFVGAIYLASRKGVLGLGRRIAAASIVFGTGLMLFSLSRSVILSMALMFLVGLGMMVQMAACNTIIQTIVDDDKRGRVLSLYIMSFIGMAPLGSLLLGALASRIGVSLTLTIGGVVCSMAAVVFTLRLPALRKAIRPIYRKKGILPAAIPEVPSIVEEL